MFNRLLIITLLIIHAFFSIAQDIPIGDWRDHLPYSEAISVSYGNNVVYCATNSAVFIYDKSDMTIEKLNLVNGLSDIGVSKIKYNNYNKKVIIAYLNGNLDIIDENKNITNLSSIKKSSISGEKTINHIYLQDKLAYLSTGFGIIVLDTDKQEIVDTYLFGPLGTSIVTNGVTLDNLNIYAATNQGVFYANKNSANLNDYNVWTIEPALGTLKYNNIVTYSNRLFVSLDSPSSNADTLYYNDSGIWQKFIPNGINVKSITTSNNTLLVTLESSIEIYDQPLNKVKTLSTVNNLSIAPNESTIDNEGIIWYAENSRGLIKSKSNSDNQIIIPNGPTSTNVFKMDVLEGELWFVSGGYNASSFVPSFIGNNIINFRVSDSWNSVGNIKDIKNGNALDAVSIAINPRNKSQVFFGTWDDGLFELNNGSVFNIFIAQNSMLDSTFFGTTKVGALKYDDNNNLWISCSFTNNQLAVKTADNNWYSYAFTEGINASNVFTDLVIDQNNYKWFVESRANSLLIFDDNKTLDKTADDRNTLLTPGNNDIPGSRLYAIAEDLDGEMWLGTDEGIAVFYNASAVFDENIKAEQIFIQQDGQTQVLLETEAVTVITVDGANRKWLGTQNSGVFLMSEDGTEQIEHFTTENSPLFSNSIFDIAINSETGEVFFGTEKGLISYKGTATTGDNDFNNVFVYPNPVKPDFTGIIAIRGLVKDTDVRITDISGNIVYQTTSLGGQAIWDGRDFNGDKVQTGVYMIFNGSADGNQKSVTKILFIH